MAGVTPAEKMKRSSGVSGQLGETAHMAADVAVKHDGAVGLLSSSAGTRRPWVGTVWTGTVPAVVLRAAVLRAECCRSFLMRPILLAPAIVAAHV